MAAIAEFSLPATEFPLGRVFERWPEATLELDQLVPAGDALVPYFWTTLTDGGAEFEAIEGLYDDLPELQSAVLVDGLGDSGLYRAKWNADYTGIMHAVAATEVTVLSATGSSEGWLFELRALEKGEFSTFHDYCRDRDIDVTLRRLYRLSEKEAGDDYGLTPEQREALLRAYDEGYYADAREVHQTALASQLDISRQAFSARLRRAYRNLIENTLARRDDRK